ncbi:MAG: hypothetical protein WCJ19_05410 [bacterium]
MLNLTQPENASYDQLLKDKFQKSLNFVGQTSKALFEIVKLPIVKSKKFMNDYTVVGSIGFVVTLFVNKSFFIDHTEAFGAPQFSLLAMAVSGAMMFHGVKKSVKK